MKRIIVLSVVVLLVLSLMGCGAGKTYEEVLSEYTTKLEELSPTLVEEFKSEATGISDIAQLAEISNAKIEELAELSNEGVSEMAEIQLKNSDDYAVYEEWAQKLMDVYEREAKKITDEYESTSDDVLNSLLP